MLLCNITYNKTGTSNSWIGICLGHTNNIRNQHTYNCCSIILTCLITRNVGIYPIIRVEYIRVPWGCNLAGPVVINHHFIVAVDIGYSWTFAILACEWTSVTIRCYSYISKRDIAIGVRNITGDNESLQCRNVVIILIDGNVIVRYTVRLERITCFIGLNTTRPSVSYC